MPFTGFSDKDNLALTDMPTCRPLHLINATLNLVGGKNLAWQERKAASFTFSRLHCGSPMKEVGYRSASDYAKVPEGPMSVGGAMAISGAAASPNMGYLSSPPLALLMAMFNVRLGAWMGNPAKQRFGRSAPTWANKLLLEEAVGRTDETHDFVYLSDGGHFENLGIYEMIRRRCKFVLAIDADADPDMGFGNLGNAVRKVYIDLGVQIHFKRPPEIYPREPKPKVAPRYAAVAEIDYGSEEDTGLLIYIKPAFYGSEPIDVYQYGQENPDFPHDSTLNQFFNESQFESDRRLGYYIMDNLLEQTNPKQDIHVVGQAIANFIASRTSAHPGSAGKPSTHAVVAD